MSRLFYHTMQDNAGNLLFGVSGTMRLAGTGTLATIYGDEALTVILPNPMTNHPSYGSFKCFLPVGDFDFYMAKSGYTFETLTGIQGYGSMAQQEANAVAITGGTATLTQVTTPERTGNDQFALRSFLAAGGGTNRWNLYLEGTAPNYLGGPLGVRMLAVTDTTVSLTHAKDTQHAIGINPTGLDAGAGKAVLFKNVGGTYVGDITTTATGVTYNTASDARLKTAVQSLVGELAAIRALRPVRFRWLLDDSEGVGFLAGEVAEHVQGVVSGEPDAVNPDGTMNPQMIDMSRLVPWLVGAVQTLAGQVETLTERVQALETALGV